MRQELKIIGLYIRAVFRESWVIVIEGLLVLADVVERIAGTWLLPSTRTKVVLGLGVLVIAQYRAYRKLFLRAHNAESRPTHLEIHEEQGSTVYVETPSGATPPNGNYFVFNLTVENKGSQTSVIRKFDLIVEGVATPYEDLEPVRRTSIHTRAGQMGLQWQSILALTSLVVPAHVWSGMLGLYVDSTLSITTQTVKCLLKITDSNGSSAERTFALRSEGWK
jgi:hypothetical protein